MAPVDLTAEEARVLGCLMEKSVTTPDNYPLSLNGLVTACNQATNRDPVVAYDDDVVERALDGLRTKGLARRVMTTGQRVVKHRQVTEEALHIGRPEFAVLGVLLLRGAQTPGELKQRTERWHGFRSTDDVEETLRRLAGTGFVEQQARRAGQKESRWAQLIVSGGAVSASPEETAAPVDEPATEAAAGEPRVETVEHSLEVRNPATGAVIRSVAVTEVSEIEQKVRRARQAQHVWSSRPYDERAAALRTFGALLDKETEDCARITTSETGKPIRQSRNEVRAVPERIAWNVDHAGEVIKDRIVTHADHLEERVTYEPMGVVAHVSAWNYPYFVGLNSIVPALLTGNAVLYKPSEYATLTGLRLVDLLHRAGVPVDVVQAVVGGGATGAALVDADIDMVCFTGSYATGTRVATAVADRFVRVQLELGGKDPAYVCDDVDVSQAAAAVAEGAFYNSGQSCSATERVYVHERIWDRFPDAFVEVVKSYRLGPPEDDATDLGPVARAAQLDVLESQVADAQARGARVLYGGHRVERPGNWFEPTVLIDVDGGAAVLRDESFGPVIALQPVTDDADALARMNDTEYGLGAAVFTRDRERAAALLSQLDVGNAYWNVADRSCVRLPWAGRRHSGIGVSMSESGVRAFVREKAWHLFGPE
jgi:acyl-CoA reductase-like NAD-dependent aldehyde dehydrogenase